MEALIVKEELKYVSTVLGVLCVTITGELKKRMLFVVNLDFYLEVGNSV